MKTKSSCIVLEGLRFHAFHGVMPQERQTGGDYLLSLRIRRDITAAMLSDNVADTINYAEAYEIARQEMDIPSRLLEHVCGRIGRRLLDRYPEAEEVGIRLVKCNPPMGADCSGAAVEVVLINDKTSDKI